MPSNRKIAKQALQNALEELRQGNKKAARSWAQCAVELAPGLEEAWLVLASVAEPHASLAYIKEALKINPGSQGARQSLFEVQTRLEKIGQEEGPKGRWGDGRGEMETEGTEEPEKPEGPQAQGEAQAAGLRYGKIKSRFLLNWFRLLPIYGLAIFTAVVLILLLFQSGIANARGYASSENSVIALQPMATSTADITPETMGALRANPLLSKPAPAKPVEPSDPVATPTPIIEPMPAPANASGEKRILVRISEQQLYAYQGETLIHRFIVSTGTEGATRVGSFSILDKIPDAYSDTLGFWMPDWLGIYWVGYLEIGIHALPVLPNGNVLWGADLGKPGAHACVVLSTVDAHTLFEWADIGTQVEITE